MQRRRRRGPGPAGATGDRPPAVREPRRGRPAPPGRGPGRRRAAVARPGREVAGGVGGADPVQPALRERRQRLGTGPGGAGPSWAGHEQPVAVGVVAGEVDQEPVLDTGRAAGPQSGHQRRPVVGVRDLDLLVRRRRRPSGSTGRASTRPSVRRRAGGDQRRRRRRARCGRRPAANARPGRKGVRSSGKCTGSAPGSGVRTHRDRRERRWDLEGRAGRRSRAVASTGTTALSLPGRVSAGASWSATYAWSSAVLTPTHRRVDRVGRRLTTQPVAQDDLVRRRGGDRDDRLACAPGRRACAVGGQRQARAGPDRAPGPARRPGPAAGSRPPSDRACPAVCERMKNGWPGVQPQPGGEVGLRPSRSSGEVEPVRRDPARCRVVVTPVTVPVDDVHRAARRTRGTRWRTGPALRWSACQPQRSTTAVSLAPRRCRSSAVRSGASRTSTRTWTPRRSPGAEVGVGPDRQRAAGRASRAGPGRSRARSGLGRPTASIARTR